MSISDTDAPTGAHTQFKEKLRSGLLKRVEVVVKQRAGPSWDERMEKAMKGFQAKQRAAETEQKKTLIESIERGRSRPTSAPVRSSAEAPNQIAMLRRRQKEMRQKEQDYLAEVDNLKEKMRKREPLFRVSEVNACFAKMQERINQRKREMTQDEHERWEHLRAVEESAANRPLLIETTARRAPKKLEKSASVPGTAGKEEGGTSRPSSAIYGGREEYEKDVRIRTAISQPDFLRSDWAQTVSAIKHKVNSRKKLHEELYYDHRDGHALTRTRLMHSFPS